MKNVRPDLRNQVIAPLPAAAGKMSASSAGVSELDENFAGTARPDWWVPLSYTEKAALIVACLIAHVFFFAMLSLPLLYDSSGYFEGGKEILKTGLFSRTSLSEWRTYGYPWFLSHVIRVSTWLGIVPRLLIFEIQLAAYVGALVTFRQVLHYSKVPGRLSSALFYCFCLNPLVLMLVAHVLTEGPSIITAVLVFSCMIYVSRVPWQSSRHTAAVVIGSFLTGAMVMIRPANSFMLPAWFLSVYLSFGNPFRSRSIERMSKAAYLLLLAGTACSVPMIPQLINNVTLYGKLTPLTAYPIGKLQAKSGIEWMKYGSVYIPGRDSRLIYENPFSAGTVVDPRAPERWYVEHPLKGMATLALHVYNVLDQDLPFVYNTRLVPWYYPAAAVSNQAMLGLAMAGAVLFFARRRDLDRITRQVLLLIAGVLACHLALHACFSVECRYGVIALLFLYPLGFLGAFALIRETNGRTRFIGLGAVVVYVLFAAWLTGWVRYHAPAIRGEKEEAALQQSFSNSGSLVTSNLTAWASGNATIGPDGQAQLKSPDGVAVSMIQHPVPVEPNTSYAITFEARSEGAVTAPLSVDFFGDQYSNPQQNYSTTAIGPAYSTVTAKWNSGPAVPPLVLLRFGTPSRNLVEIRHVTLRK